MLSQVKHPLTASFEYIFSEDDAVDHSHADFDATRYERELEPQYLPLRAGERPTRFVCKPLAREVMTKIARITGITGTDNYAEACQVAVAYGLKSIIDGPLDLQLKFDRSGERLENKSLDDLYNIFMFGFFSRLGEAIVRRSTLSPF